MCDRCLESKRIFWWDVLKSIQILYLICSNVCFTWLVSYVYMLYRLYPGVCNQWFCCSNIARASWQDNLFNSYLSKSLPNIFQIWIRLSKRHLCAPFWQNISPFVSSYSGGHMDMGPEDAPIVQEPVDNNSGQESGNV